MSFTTRFLKAIMGSIVILLFWLFLAFQSIGITRFIFLGLIFLMFVYTLVAVYRQTVKCINEITVDNINKIVSIQINKYDSKWRILNLKPSELELKKVRIPSSIYKHYMLELYKSGKKIFTQYAVGGWTHKKMDELIEVTNRMRKNEV